MPEPVLQMSGVAVVRDGSTLLADVDWTVRDGERWVVLGPNGAGKSTLMHVAGASLFPSRGTVVLLGERFGATDLGELRTRVGLSSSSLADRGQDKMNRKKLSYGSLLRRMGRKRS